MGTRPRVEVWTACVDAGDRSAEPVLDRWLNEDERKRFARLVALPDRMSFAAAHALLHWAIWRTTGIALSEQVFGRSAFDRPLLVTATGGTPSVPTFSISHARGLVAVAIGSCQSIGVDVETADRRIADPLSLAQAVFADAETHWVAQPSEPERQLQRMLQIWTIKEALLKAVGVGLRAAVDSFIVRADPPRLVTSLDELRARGRWHLQQWQPDSHAWAALAVDEDSALPVEVRKWHLNFAELVELLS